MRLLCITGYYKPAYVYGGPVRSVSTLCENLASRGIDVTIFTTNANGPGQSLNVPTSYPVELEGVRVHYFPRSELARLFPFHSSELGRACWAQMDQFDLVYFCATWTYPMFVGGRAACAANIPYIISPMGSFMRGALKEKWFKKWLYFHLVEKHLVNQAQIIRCTSALEEEQLQDLSLRPHSVIIPEGINLDFFSSLPKRGDLRKALGLSSKAQLSIFVGRLAPEKRLSFTIQAFSQIAGQLPHTHLALIGPDQGCRSSLQHQVDVLKLKDRVHFTGKLTGADLLQAYADADLLVLLSRRENFGMAAIEAMAAGLPVLLSNAVGLADYVKQAQAGFVVSDRLEQVVEKWSYLLSGIAQRREMGYCGRQLVKESFSKESVSLRMRELFSNVIQESKRKVN